MLNELLDTFLKDPVKAIALGAIALVCYFIISFKKLFFRRLDSFETAMAGWESRLKVIIAEQRKMLMTHGGQLVRAVESINGDMTKVQKGTHEMRVDIIERTQELKETVTNVVRETKTMGHVYELATEKFETKFSSVVDLRKNAEEAIGRVTKIETAQDETFGRLARVEKESADFKISVDTRFQSTGKILRSVFETSKKKGGE